MRYRRVVFVAGLLLFGLGAWNSAAAKEGSNACGEVEAFKPAYDLSKSQFPTVPPANASIEQLEAYLHAWRLYRQTDIEPYNNQLKDEFSPGLGRLSDDGQAAARAKRCTWDQFEELKAWIQDEYVKVGTTYLRPYQIASDVAASEIADTEARIGICIRQRRFGRICGQ